MEARLTDLPYKPQVVESPNVSVPQSELVARIDRYFRAAGVEDDTCRSRLIAATARDLLARGSTGKLSWAEIIAAVDRLLADELALEGDGRDCTGARGRVALRTLGDDALRVAADQAGHREAPAPPLGRVALRGTPPRSRRVMRAQDLSLWRPSAAWLHRLQLSPAKQGLAASIGWLAVLFIP